MDDFIQVLPTPERLTPSNLRWHWDTPFQHVCLTVVSPFEVTACLSCLLIDMLCQWDYIVWINPGRYMSGLLLMIESMLQNITEGTDIIVVLRDDSLTKPRFTLQGFLGQSNPDSPLLTTRRKFIGTDVLSEYLVMWQDDRSRRNLPICSKTHSAAPITSNMFNIYYLGL